jgi:alpha/beta hydrolase family protein
VTDYVLLHSTGQAASGWDRVAASLREKGAVVHTMDLPNDPMLHAQDFAGILAEAFNGVEPPVVVAHSGAGPLLPAAATALGARLQVWLAAWVPHEELTFMQDVREHLGEAFDPGWVGKDPIADDDVAQEFLYHDCDGETVAWALSTRREFYPEGAYNERIALNTDVASVYISAIRDRTILPTWQERMARERLGVEPITIDSGHCPNVSQPRELGNLLLRISP